jgi:hypothetical protein
MKSHVPKQAKVLEEAQLVRFFNEEPSTDNNMCVEVVASAVIAAGLRIDSFYNIQLSDVECTADGGPYHTDAHETSAEGERSRHGVQPAQLTCQALTSRNGSTATSHFVLRPRRHCRRD